MNRWPNQSMQLTAPAVTSHASNRRLSTSTQVPRRAPRSLISESLGVATRLVKIAICFFLFATGLLATDAAWKKQSGRFASFSTPPSMAKDTNAYGVDSLWDEYKSAKISLSFDSDITKLPATLQNNLQKAFSAWAAQRKTDWSKSFYVEDAGRTIASVAGYNNPERDPARPHYLYFGFPVGERSFALHICFRSVDDLPDVERILKSLQLKVQ